MRANETACRCGKCGYISRGIETILPDEVGNICCPICGASDWSDVELCQKCGEYYEKGCGANGICLPCLMKRRKDYEFLRGCADEVPVPLNGFLVWMFQPDEIEEILMGVLRYRGMDCYRYINDFPEDVAEKILGNDKK